MKRRPIHIIRRYAESEYRKELPLTKRVRIGEAIAQQILKPSNSPLLLHGLYDPEDSDPDKVLANSGRMFDPFVQVVDPDPEPIEPIEPSDE